MSAHLSDGLSSHLMDDRQEAEFTGPSYNLLLLVILAYFFFDGHFSFLFEDFELESIHAVLFTPAGQKPSMMRH